MKSLKSLRTESENDDILVKDEKASEDKTYNLKRALDQAQRRFDWEVKYAEKAQAGVNTLLNNKEIGPQIQSYAIGRSGNVYVASFKIKVESDVNKMQVDYDTAEKLIKASKGAFDIKMINSPFNESKKGWNLTLRVKADEKI